MNVDTPLSPHPLTTWSVRCVRVLVHRSSYVINQKLKFISVSLAARLSHPPSPQSFRQLNRRMKRNPHVLDARACRAVLWWNILSEAMDAAREAEERRSRRRQTRQAVVALAVTQRRGFRQMEAISVSCSSSPARTWTLPPLGAGGGRRCGVSSGSKGVAGREGLSVHLDEAAVLSRVYEFL